MHWMEATSKIGFCSKNRTGEIVAQDESRPKLLEQWSIGKVEDGDDVLHVRSLPASSFQHNKAYVHNSAKDPSRGRFLDLEHQTMSKGLLPKSEFQSST